MALTPVVSCSHPELPSLADPTSTVALTAPTADGAPTAPRTPEILSDGAAPRRALRFELRPGQRVVVAVTTDLSLTQVGKPRDHSIEPPPVTQTIEYRVRSVAADGATVSFRIVDIVADTSNAAEDATAVLQLTKALRPVVGTTGSGHIDPLGRFSSVRFDLPSGLPAAVRDRIQSLPAQMAQLLPQLPREPVGVGGSWRSIDRFVVAGVALTHRSTFTVISQEGSLLRYRVNLSARAGRQALPTAALGAGTTVELRSSTLRGTGTGTVDLASLTNSAFTEASGRQNLIVSAENEPVEELVQRLHLSVRVRAGGP
ncbi:MAG: hypothetical protein ACR2MB_03825 [Acidimicrobiales bacterium]